MRQPGLDCEQGNHSSFSIVMTANVQPFLLNNLFEDYHEMVSKQTKPLLPCLVLFLTRGCHYFIEHFSVLYKSWKQPFFFFCFFRSGMPWHTLQSQKSNTTLHETVPNRKECSSEFISEVRDSFFCHIFTPPTSRPSITYLLFSCWGLTFALSPGGKKGWIGQNKIKHVGENWKRKAVHEILRAIAAPCNVQSVTVIWLKP